MVKHNISQRLSIDGEYSKNKCSAEAQAKGYFAGQDCIIGGHEMRATVGAAEGHLEIEAAVAVKYDTASATDSELARSVVEMLDQAECRPALDVVENASPGRFEVAVIY